MIGVNQDFAEGVGLLTALFLELFCVEVLLSTPALRLSFLAKQFLQAS